MWIFAMKSRDTWGGHSPDSWLIHDHQFILKGKVLMYSPQLPYYWDVRWYNFLLIVWVNSSLIFFKLFSEKIAFKIWWLTMKKFTGFIVFISFVKKIPANQRWGTHATYIQSHMKILTISVQVNYLELSFDLCDIC